MLFMLDVINGFKTILPITLGQGATFEPELSEKYAAAGNKKLMRGILRDEMGFDGVLVSDWAAIEESIYHGYCADREEAMLLEAVCAAKEADVVFGSYAPI